MGKTWEQKTAHLIIDDYLVIKIVIFQSNLFNYHRVSLIYLFTYLYCTCMCTRCHTGNTWKYDARTSCRLSSWFLQWVEGRVFAINYCGFLADFTFTKFWDFWPKKPHAFLTEAAKCDAGKSQEAEDAPTTRTAPAASAVSPEPQIQSHMAVFQWLSHAMVIAFVWGSFPEKG